MASRLRRHEIACVWLRYVADECHIRRSRGEYYPWCRGGRGRCRSWPIWNVRHEYRSHSVRGGGMSAYWCDDCLPSRWREGAHLLRERMREGDPRRSRWAMRLTEDGDPYEEAQGEEEARRQSRPDDTT